MVKKGLSLEQKREKVLEIFHECDDVYQLKEIEKKAAARGVVVQSVKEVVQSLVDDDLVHQVRCSSEHLRLPGAMAPMLVAAMPHQKMYVKASARQHKEQRSLVVIAKLCGRKLHMLRCCLTDTAHMLV